MFGVPVIGWVLSISLATIFVAFHYFYLLKERPLRLRFWWFALGFRWLGSIGLILLFFNPWWLDVKRVVEKPILLVYSDVSASITSADLKKWSRGFERVVAIKNLEFRKYQFAQDVVLGDTNLGLDVNHTNLGSVLRHAKGAAADANVAGVILMTDGISNDGRSPQYEMGLGLPIIAVGVGNAQPQIDALVAGVHCNDEVFLENRFLVEVSVKTQLLKGQPIAVRLSAGAVSLEQKWTPANGQDLRRFSFEVKPNQLGLLPIKVHVSSASKEVNLANNDFVRYTTVVDKRKRIALIFRSPHPDIAALKLALSKSGQFVVQATDYNQPVTDADVLVLHGFTLQSAGEVKRVSDWISAGKAIWFFLNDKQSEVNIEKVLGIEVGVGRSRNWQEVQPAWNNNGVAWGLDDVEQRRWQQFPPVSVPIAKQSIPAGGEVLLFQRWSGQNTTIPLMLHWKKESAALAVFFGEGVWRWRMHEMSIHGDARAFDAWVRRSVGLLAMGSDAQKAVEIIQTNTTIDARDRSVVRVVCRDKSGLIDNNAPRQIQVTDAKGRVRALNLVKDENGWSCALVGFTPGEYRLKARNLAVNAQTEANFLVVDQPAETLNTQADHRLLKQISEMSKGVFLPLDGIDSLASVIAQKISTKPVLRDVVENQHWWNSLVWLLFVALMFSAEWLVRRILGNY